MLRREHFQDNQHEDKTSCQHFFLSYSWTQRVKFSELMRPRLFPSYLRCNVVWCSTESVCIASWFHVFFAHSKISQLDVAIFV